MEPLDLSWGRTFAAGFPHGFFAWLRRERSTPVVVFSYLNPIMNYGVDAFLSDAEAAGAQGVLVTDLPVGGDPALETKFKASKLDLIRLIAPTTTPARIREIVADEGVPGGEAGVEGPEILADERTRVPYAQLMNLSAIVLGQGLEHWSPGRMVRVAETAQGDDLGGPRTDARQGQERDQRDRRAVAHPVLGEEAAIDGEAPP